MLLLLNCSELLSCILGCQKKPCLFNKVGKGDFDHTWNNKYHRNWNKCLLLKNEPLQSYLVRFWHLFLSRKFYLVRFWHLFFLVRFWHLFFYLIFGIYWESNAYLYPCASLIKLRCKLWTLYNPFVSDRPFAYSRHKTEASKFKHRSPKHNVSNGGLWLNWNIRVCMEIRSLTFIWLNLFNVCVIYRIKTLGHSMVSFFLILESLNEIWGYLSEFWKSSTLQCSK